MPQPHITVVDAADAPVWHVGRAPDPWAWTDWRYAGNQRWDDVDGVFRTIYAADSLYACYVEVLAYARPDMDPGDADLLAGITEDTEDAAEYPSPPAGVIPTDWIQAAWSPQPSSTAPMPMSAPPTQSPLFDLNS